MLVTRARARARMAQTVNGLEDLSTSIHTSMFIDGLK